MCDISGKITPKDAQKRKKIYTVRQVKSPLF